MFAIPAPDAIANVAANRRRCPEIFPFRVSPRHDAPSDCGQRQPNGYLHGHDLDATAVAITCAARIVGLRGRNPTPAELSLIRDPAKRNLTSAFYTNSGTNAFICQSANRVTVLSTRYDTSLFDLRNLLLLVALTPAVLAAAIGNAMPATAGYIGALSASSGRLDSAGLRTLLGPRQTAYSSGYALAAAIALACALACLIAARNIVFALV